jgi:hypothetical protein
MKRVRQGRALARSLFLPWKCTAAVKKENDAAIEYLQKADTLNPQSPVQLLTEFDFKWLRKDPRFVALVANSKQRSESLA